MGVRYFCDRCGVDVLSDKDLFIVNVASRRFDLDKTQFETKKQCVCKKCKDTHDKINTVLTDIRFELIDKIWKNANCNDVDVSVSIPNNITISPKYKDGDKVWTRKGGGTVLYCWYSNETPIFMYNVGINNGCSVYQFREDEICLNIKEFLND